MARHVLTQDELEKGRKNAKTPEAQKKRVESKKKNFLMRQTIDEAIKDMLLSGRDIKNTPYYQLFINNFFETARKFPNSNAGLFVADRLIANDLMKELDSSFEKQKAENLSFKKWQIHDLFFDKQKEVISEIHQRRKIFCLTSRRAGKTTMNSGIIVDTALIPDSPIMYFNLTFQNGIKQIFDEVVRISDIVGLEIVRSSKSEGVIEWSNGSSLKIHGNSNNSEADKARGFKARLVIIDEIGHQRNIDYLLNEVLLPLMADFTDSTLLLTGTPSRVPHHFSTKMWESDKTFWKRNWNLLDNPHITNAQEFIEEQCKSKGLTIESPFIQREYFGKLIADTEALIFKNRKTFSGNVIDKIINQEITITDFAIGVDYGFADYNAMITVAYDKNKKQSYVIKEDKFNKSTISEIVDVIEKHYQKAVEICKKIKLDFNDHVKIYADTSDESITAELRVKKNLPAFNCYKYDKMFAIEMLAEELRTGRMQIAKGGILDDEMDRILYARDKEDNIINELDDMSYHADAVMALLYASRKIFFDMDYQINFKESAPKTSDYITDENGTIKNYNLNNDLGNFENIGTIG